MGTALTLAATDGHKLGAYRADPVGQARGGVVVIQEIFGLNHHIRAVCDRLAAVGYAAVAPALFDRFAKGFESGYSPEEIGKARDLAMKNRDWSHTMLDTKAAYDLLQSVGPVAIVGFCMGGSVSFLAATKIDGLVAASCFYGGAVVQFANDKPKCPTQLHFGEHDEHIPMTDVEKIKAKRPDCEVFVYPAGHGFYCDERASFHAPSAKLAWERTLDLFDKAIGSAERSRARA